MERRAQNELASVPRIYRREAAPEVREYLVLSLALGGAATGRYVAIRSAADAATPEIESYDVSATISSAAMLLQRAGRRETAIGTIDGDRLTFADGGAPWRRVSRDELDDDVVRFAERPAPAPAPVLAAVPEPPERPEALLAAAREATARRAAAATRAAEACAAAEVLEEELARAREEHAQARGQADAAERALAASMRREAEALERAEGAKRELAAAGEAAAREAAARLARERDAYVRARVAARLAAASPAARAVPTAAAEPRPLPADGEERSREEQLEARYAEASAAAARTRAALEEHRTHWSARFGRTPQALLMAYKAAERELNTARDELTLFRRAQRQRRLEVLRAEHEAGRSSSS